MSRSFFMVGGILVAIMLGSTHAAAATVPARCEDLLNHQPSNNIAYTLRLTSFAEVDKLSELMTPRRSGNMSANEIVAWLKNLLSREAAPSEYGILSGSLAIRNFLNDVWSHYTPYFRTTRSGAEFNYTGWNVYTFKRKENGRITLTIDQSGEISEHEEPAALKVVEAVHLRDHWDKAAAKSTDFFLDVKIELIGDLSILADLDLGSGAQELIYRRP